MKSSPASRVWAGPALALSLRRSSAARARRSFFSALAMDETIVDLEIAALGHRGEGIAEGAAGPIYVPYALAGERVSARVAGDRAGLVGILRANPHRIAPDCPYFGDCGGCAAQHMAPTLYAQWKRDILVRALAQARVEAEVRPLIDAH